MSGRIMIMQSCQLPEFTFGLKTTLEWPIRFFFFHKKKKRKPESDPQPEPITSGEE